MADKIKSINLLPDKGHGLFDQFLNWALTVGRLLIILTETLALGTFLYRFSLDMKITDLHDLIKNQSAVVEQFKSIEDNVRNLQTRLAFAKSADATSGIAPEVFADIIELGRGKVTFRNLLVSKDNIKIEVQAANSNSLNTFVNNLKGYQGITSVSVDSVENKTTIALIYMSLSAHLKQPVAQNENVPNGGSIILPK
ncbi:MAG TPA: hypothetical protein VLG67_04100 [Candidatus Saccharimonadales bacterium]|nr:hypothetical protein [Candidatus Saccharimonadales bacterium]